MATQESSAFDVRDLLRAQALTRLTSANENTPPDEEDEDLRAMLAGALLTTETAATSDPERDEDDDFRPLAQATLTTATKATGDNEGDPEDNELLAHGALLTTLTESSGDNESDPDDDSALRYLGGSEDGTLPLAYRYAEAEVDRAPRFSYDSRRQIHVLGDGVAVIDAIARLPSPAV